MIDDALDYSADQEKLGKSVGDDFAEGKVTLPVLLAYEQGDADEQDFWRRTIGGWIRTTGISPGCKADRPARRDCRHGSAAERYGARATWRACRQN